MMYDHEKSDPTIVAVKPTNKAGQPAAELVEPRAGAEGNVLPRLREAHSNDGRMLADGYAGKRCFQRKVRCHATELDDAGTVSTIGCGRTYLVRFLPAVEKKLAMVSRNS